MSAYRREKPTMASSLALWRFRRDRGMLSDHYWAATLSGEYLLYSVKDNREDESTEQVLTLVGSRFERRVAHDISGFRSQMKATERWHRLTTVLLMASAFERFVVGSATAAIASDPALNVGFPKHVDGLTVKKYGLNLTLPSTERLVTGEWSGRIAAYNDLFGEVPSALAKAEGALEKLRKMRNDVAHDFGLSSDKVSRAQGLLLGARSDRFLVDRVVTISHERVQKYLALLGDVSQHIDQHLVGDFIGGYETAALYLDWTKDMRRLEGQLGLDATVRRLEKAPRFRKVLNKLLDTTVASTNYAASLIGYVDAL